jgi:hypothetical protein
VHKGATVHQHLCPSKAFGTYAYDAVLHCTVMCCIVLFCAAPALVRRALAWTRPGKIVRHNALRMLTLNNLACIQDRCVTAQDCTLEL